MKKLLLAAAILLPIFYPTPVQAQFDSPEVDIPMTVVASEPAPRHRAVEQAPEDEGTVRSYYIPADEGEASRMAPGGAAMMSRQPVVAAQPAREPTYALTSDDRRARINLAALVGALIAVIVYLMSRFKRAADIL